MKRLSPLILAVIAVMLLGITANAASMKYDDGNLTIKDAPAGAILLHAQYDDNGVLERVDISNVENGTTSITAENGDKLFLWSGIGSITPLCRAIEVGTYDGELIDEPVTTPDAVSSATQVEETPSPETTPGATPEVGSKILVAYFSRTGENYSVGVVDKGNTSYIADYIAEQTEADIFEIIPEVPYPTDYTRTTEIATEEKNSNARPKYIGDAPNFEQYDTVFLGYPIWWGDMPMIMYTFIESHDFAGKKVCPFNTHEGSGNAGTASTIKSKLPQATVTDYLAIRGSDAQRNDTSMKNTVAAWLKKLGYTK